MTPHPKRCETCRHHDISDISDSCPDEDVCGKTGCTISPPIKSFIEIHGCGVFENRISEQSTHEPKPRPPCEECVYQSNSAEHDARIRHAQTLECRNIVWNKMQHNMCDKLCDKCFLCDNTGGCIAEDTIQARLDYARMERGAGKGAE